MHGLLPAVCVRVCVYGRASVFYCQLGFCGRVRTVNGLESLSSPWLQCVSEETRGWARRQTLSFIQ